MQTPLDQWQGRLERHFESLAQKRAGSGFPIFALEHGLSDDELSQIGPHLLARVKSDLRLSPHWLLWVIYATERGYGYAGDEYWRSFEEHTPFWESGDRYKLVAWFSKFQNAYDGVVPAGPWASHFRIIAWPITHAILPRYLQRQFARALYDLRYRLAGLANFEPAAIGHLLAVHAHSSTRFGEFLQQEELTGRIVLALLDQTPAGGQEPIYPPTLQRIVADLEKVRHAREWLKETQREVKDRFTGIGRGGGPPSQRPGASREGFEGKAAIQPNIRPNLLLRYSGAGTWSVVMDIPDFRSLAVNAEIRTFLKTTRCRLNGADDPKPAGWLLSGNRKAILKSWPHPQESLIQFERSHGIVDHFLDSGCRLSTGLIWLFRVGQDGIAREITGRIVRPGYEYIVVTGGSLPKPCPWMDGCSVDCAGVKAFRLEIPDPVSAEDMVWLEKIGVQVARTIRVWPSGLPGRAWDGEGSSEWLTTEAPYFGIIHDHPVEAYCLRLNDGAETTIEAGGVGYPTFVRLPPLNAGTHILRVQARPDSTRSAIPDSPAAEGFLILNVREPEPWTPGRSSHTGLIVTVDPHDADLDTFWENCLKVSVIGPESHRVTCTVTLTKSDGEEIFSEQVCNAMDLPVTPEFWSRKFSQFVQREHNAWRYLEASAGCLIVKGEELGEYVVRFERDALPIRWVVRNEHGRLTVRLIDDTGHEQSQPACLRFAMERPASPENLTPSYVLSGSAVEPPGGLFVAQQGEYQDAVAVSAGLSGTGLQGLGVTPRFGEIEDGSVNLEQACRFLELWCNARLAGPLASVRRQKVTDELLRAIYKVLCGASWASAEAAFCSNPSAKYALDGLQRGVDRNNGFAAVLRRDFAHMNTAFDGAAQWYAELAARYRVCSERRLCEFALRLASQPQRVPGFYGDELDGLLKESRNNPAILRGARLLALLCANEEKLGPVPLLPRWAW